MARRDIVFVVGMPRSGTSALTRVLSLCGCALPRSVLAPRDLNPKGFWEPVDAVRMNHAFLAAHYDACINQMLHLDPEVKCSSEEREAFIDEIRAFLSECPREPILVVKELDIVVLMQSWVEAARREGLCVNVVVSIRHPQEVLASCFAGGAQRTVDLDAIELARREQMSVIILARNFLAERNSRGLSRVFIDYSNLIRNWRLEVDRVSEALSLDLRADERAIDAFLTPDLYRQRASTKGSGGIADASLLQLYSLLSEAALVGTIDTSGLDRLAAEFRADARVSEILEDLRTTRGPFSGLGEVPDWPVWQSGQNF